MKNKTGSSFRHTSETVKPQDTFQCKFCTKQFTTKGNLNVHLKTYHQYTPGSNNIYFGNDFFIILNKDEGASVQKELGEIPELISEVLSDIMDELMNEETLGKTKKEGERV